MLAVVLFHLGLPGFSGGFVGVDVFFVISGYLITRQISERLEAGNFRFRHFYARRIRRLLPALLATIAASMLAASIILLPADLAAFSRSALAALFSASNIVFYLEAGYWAAASELKPLLHTWSLGVEEQFYLLWPLLMVALVAIRRWLPMTLSFLILGLASLAACIAYTASDPDAAFFLAPFRVFQFVAGALLLPVMVYARSKHPPGPVQRVLAECALWSGLLLIAASVTLIDDQTGFPGWSVLAPTTGAALVLLSGGLPSGIPASARILMCNPLALWLGTASYAMYLAHWPVIVFYRYQHGIELNWQEQALLALGTLAATWLLHYGIERRFYHRRTTEADDGGRGTDPGRFFSGLAAIVALLGVVNIHSWQSGGWSWRYPELLISDSVYRDAQQKRFSHLREACSLQRIARGKACDLDGGVRVLVLGNSHEPDGYNFFRAGYARHNDLRFVLFGTTNRCGELGLVDSRVVSDRTGCQQRLDALFDPGLLATIDWVIYAANKPFASEPKEASKQHMLLLLSRLKAAKPELRVITLGGYINTDVDCALLINQARSTDACKNPERVSYFAAHPEHEGYYRDIMALTDYYVDRVGLLCPGRELSACPTSTADGTPAFYDRHHLSLEFAEMSGRLYAKQHPGLFDKTPAAGN